MKNPRGKAAGTRVERKVLQLLRDEGYFAFRTPASLGVCDVVGLKAAPQESGPRIRFIEVKSTVGGPYEHFRPTDRRDLRDAAFKAGASAELCWWPPRKKPTFIPSTDWPGA